MAKHDKDTPERDASSPGSSGNRDDGLSALQLPFLQSNEMSKFLNTSKEWISEGINENDLAEDVDTLTPDFLGHYSAPNSMYPVDSLSNNGQNNMDYYQQQTMPFSSFNDQHEHNQGQLGSPSDISGSNQPQNSNNTGFAGVNPSAVSNASGLNSGFGRSHGGMLYGTPIAQPSSSSAAPNPDSESGYHSIVGMGDGKKGPNNEFASMSNEYTSRQSNLYGGSSGFSPVQSYGSNLGMNFANESFDHHSIMQYTQNRASALHMHQNVGHTIHPDNPANTSADQATRRNGNNRPTDSLSPFPNFMSSLDAKGYVGSPMISTSSPMGSSKFLTFSPSLGIDSPLNLAATQLGNSPLSTSDALNIEDHASQVTGADLKPVSRTAGTATPSAKTPARAVAGRLLSFLPAFKETILYDGRGNQVEVDLTVSLAGNFFLSEISPPDDKGDGNDEDEENNNDESNENGQGSQDGASRSHHVENNITSSTEEDKSRDSMRYELTFYRRNLFQVTATVSNAHSAVYAGNAENPQQRSRILSLSLAVTVLGSQDKKLKKLLYCLPKSSASQEPRKGSKFDNTDGTEGDSKSKNEAEPAVKLIYPTDSGYDNVVSWKRLQFRSATSHNGHRKFQHYFSICVSVYAELENTQRVCIINAYSRPIVVRGRNPRFYQNRNHIIISEIDRDPVVAMAVADLLSELSYYPDFIAKRANSAVNTIPTSIKLENDKHEEKQASSSDAVRKLTQLYHKQSVSGPSKGPVVKHSQSRDRQLISGGKQKSRTDTESHDETVAVSDDETKKSAVHRMKERQDYYQEHYVSSAKRFEKPRGNSVSSKSGSKEEDYEYFAMPVNYWLPPVEVVYRPHALHHPMQMPKANPKAGFDPSKRYFSAVE